MLYKFDEAVRDGVVLDLKYESKTIPQDLTSEDKINEWFDVKTIGLAPRAKARLKARWANMQKVFSSRSRLEKIANDIIFDFATKPRLMDGNGNAILIASSVYSACQYYEVFQNKGFKKCAIISSYSPKTGDLRTEAVSDEEETEVFTKYEIYNKMLDGQSVEDFEAEAKRKFINEPYNMKLLIVVDKLLTGFDAPPCTYLYIDKPMHNHGLFQAICRVNRLHDDSKEFGYIVDYRELFGDLTDAIKTYTAGAFDAYDAEDVEGLLKNRNEESRKHFLDILDEFEELCEGVALPKKEIDYIKYFCGESSINADWNEEFARSREKLYRLVNKLVRAFAEFKPIMHCMGYSSDEQQKMESKVTFFIQLSETIGQASGDFIDLKQYEPGMRHLIDNYIIAFDAEEIGLLDNFTLLDFIITKEEQLKGGDKASQESAAETIENNIRRKVVEKVVVNPAYYAKMSEVLEQIILERKKQVLSYKGLLSRYMELAKSVTNPENNTRYPETVKNSPAMRAFYDNFGQDEVMAKALHMAIMSSKQEGFRTNSVKINAIKRALYKILNNKEKVEEVYKLAEKQEEY